MLKRAQGGFTLVEVLVTVFVVAIGLLAAAGLQAVSKKAAIEAMQRTTATVIAQDMLERIRANSLEINAYTNNGERLVNQAVNTTVCNATLNCNTRQLVDHDLNRWWEALDGATEQVTSGGTTSNGGGLRSPAGCIRTNGTMVEVVVVWRGLGRLSQTSDNADEDPVGDTCNRNGADYELDSTANDSYRRVLRLRGHIRSGT